MLAGGVSGEWGTVASLEPARVQAAYALAAAGAAGLPVLASALNHAPESVPGGAAPETAQGGSDGEARRWYDGGGDIDGVIGTKLPFTISRPELFVYR
eukprot:COSAG04_NODE_3059_length_3223_cov_4.698464_4_plen_98_part_00